tara:strand:+ start:45 stop:374 length:330 start_codon:yes stop_codon:yes gene_type:complete
MPNFPKNTGFKMPMKEYGKGKSPFQVSDEMLIEGEAKLDEQKLKFKEPGWAKAARGLHEGVKNVAEQAKKMATGGTSEVATVADIVNKNKGEGEDEEILSGGEILGPVG